MRRRAAFGGEEELDVGDEALGVREAEVDLSQDLVVREEELVAEEGIVDARQEQDISRPQAEDVELAQRRFERTLEDVRRTQVCLEVEVEREDEVEVQLEVEVRLEIEVQL